MLLRIAKILGLLVSVAATFAIVTAFMLRIIPAPRKDLDYLVVGTVATFFSLLILFLILIATWAKKPDVFVKRRRSSSE